MSRAFAAACVIVLVCISPLAFADDVPTWRIGDTWDYKETGS